MAAHVKQMLATTFTVEVCVAVKVVFGGEMSTTAGSFTCCPDAQARFIFIMIDVDVAVRVHVDPCHNCEQESRGCNDIQRLPIMFDCHAAHWKQKFASGRNC